ncbi:MAG: metal ABC transporter permease [Alphaproteobacteria bacterium]
MIGYNSLLVLLGTAILGLGAAVIGVFMMLRGRAMAADAASHATLPGVALGFLLALSLGWHEGRHLPLMLFMAFLTAWLGMFTVNWLQRRSILSADTAIAVVLSVFFAAGLLLLGYIQHLPLGSIAGLDSFLLGQTASLQKDEIIFLSLAMVAVLFIAFILRKQYIMLAFDPNFSHLQGYQAARLDGVMTSLMLVVVCLGLKTVGVVLVLAMLIMPAAAAKMLTQRLRPLFAMAALLGVTSAMLGVILSSRYPNIPTGSMIVLLGFGLVLLALPVRLLRRIA